MSVNRSYWSGSETKTVYGVDVELPLFPVDSQTTNIYKNFANSFVAKTKNNGVDWKQPIDTSYSFCRTDNNYCGCKSVLTCGYATSYYPAPQRGKKYNISINAFDIGLGIKANVTSTTKNMQYTASSTSTLKCTNLPNTNNENKKPDTASYYGETFYKYCGNFAPILRVNPRDYMLVIMVNCTKLKDGKTLSDFETDSYSIFNGSYNCDLKTYLSTYYEQGYTIITGVWCFVVAKPTSPTNIGSSIAPVLYSTNTIDVDYTGSDGDSYTFSANLPSMYSPFTGTSFRYTSDDEKSKAASFSLQNDLQYGEIIIAGTLTGSIGYISYPYEFGIIHLGDYFKLYETSNKTYLLTAATIDDFGGLDAFREWCRKQTAYFGLPFRENRDFTNVDEDLTDERIMWGIIDGSGVTHGEYTIGAGNTKNPMYNSDNMQNDSGWKPGGGGSGPEKPTSDGDKDAEDGYIKGSGTHFTSFSLDDIGLQRYIVTKSDFDNMYEYLNQCLDYPNAYKRFLTNGTAKGISSDVLKQIWSENFPTAAEYTAYIFSKLGYSNDPRANIVSLMLVPFELTKTQTSRRIRLGDGIVGGDFEIYIPTGASTIEEKVVYAPASTFSPAQVKGVEKTVEIIWSGSQNYTIEHPEKWKDFRAYPPYTRAELTIPFHGTIELDPSIAIGKKLSIVLLLDTITGASIANVRLDGEIYASIPGQCGFNVPFSVDASSMTASGLMGLSAQSQVNKLSQQRNSLTGAMTVSSSLANGNPVGAIEGIASTLISNKELGIYESAVDFNIQHATDGRIVSNAASALVSFGMPISPRITWHLPLSLGFTNAEYGRTVGFACAKTGKISNFSGYTEFSNADLSAVSATEQEKAMILAQLQNGVII